MREWEESSTFLNRKVQTISNNEKKGSGSKNETFLTDEAWPHLSYKWVNLLSWWIKPLVNNAILHFINGINTPEVLQNNK